MIMYKVKGSTLKKYSLIHSNSLSKCILRKYFTIFGCELKEDTYYYIYSYECQWFQGETNHTIKNWKVIRATSWERCLKREITRKY